MTTIRLFIGTLLLVFLTLNIWCEGYIFGCYMLAFPIVFILTISYSFIELKMYERICVKKCYFLHNSLFARLLSSRVIVIIIYFIGSIFMSISALALVIDFTINLWLYLVTHILITLMLYNFFTNQFKTIIQPKFVLLLAREWTINITGIIFVIIYIYLIYTGYEPAYLKIGLYETVQVASNEINSECNIINSGLKIQKELESMGWWIVKNTSSHVYNEFVRLSIWISFIVMHSFAILGINRFIAQVVYMLDIKLNKGRII